MAFSHETILFTNICVNYGCLETQRETYRRWEKVRGREREIEADSVKNSERETGSKTE